MGVRVNFQLFWRKISHVRVEHVLITEKVLKEVQVLSSGIGIGSPEMVRVENLWTEQQLLHGPVDVLL